MGGTGADKPSSSPPRGRSAGGQAKGHGKAARFVKCIITNLNKNNRYGPSEIKASDVNGDPENWSHATVSVLDSFPVAPCVSTARDQMDVRTDVFFPSSSLLRFFPVPITTTTITITLFSSSAASSSTSSRPFRFLIVFRKVLGVTVMTAVAVYPLRRALT